MGRDDAQIDATLAIIAAVSPDILLLTDVDFDPAMRAATKLAERAGYPHHYARLPNTGLMTDLDLDQNGRLGEARDAQGYGRFTGDGGMLILSRWPVEDGEVRDFSDLLWRDLPGATLPEGWPDTVWQVQRLSHAGHWVVPIRTPEGPLSLLAYAASPPVFDGIEDRNGLRNRDELLLWEHVLSGTYGPIPDRYVVIGNANLDPSDGQGHADAMRAFLGGGHVQDAEPSSRGGRAAASPGHRGDPALDTVDWRESGPGNLRVSYVLPDPGWTVTDAGVFWPGPDDPLAALLGRDGLAAGPHRLVWVDVRREK